MKVFPALLRKLFLISLVFLAACQNEYPVNQAEIDALTAAGLERGKHYKVLKKPLDIPGDAKISVVEFFWYGCSHCYKLDAPLHDWVRKLPSDVAFIKMPAIWSPAMEHHARAHFIAEPLQLPALEQSLFGFIMSLREVGDLDQQRALLKQHFTRFHFEAEDFEKNWASEETEARLVQTRQWQSQAKVEGTPAIIVNGRYTLNKKEVHATGHMIQVTDKMVRALLTTIGEP